MYNLKNQKIDFDFKPQYIKEEVHNGKLQRSRTEVGDLIMNIVGPPLGKLAIIPSSLPQCNFNQAAVLIRPYAFKDILVKYLFYYLSQMSEIDSISTRGSAGQVNISLTQAQNMRVPMPPLAEQKRIIAEITHWFSLIDEIESNKQEILEFIDQAKSKVLDLAIHGKLVPQDPSDEPAIELLKRINPNFVPCDTSHYGKPPFEIPKNWVWVRGSDIFNPMKSIKPQGEYFDYIDIDAIDNKSNMITAPKHLLSRNAPSRATRQVSKGDILFSLVRPYLRNIAKVDSDNYIASTGFYVCKPNRALTSDYCFYMMISNYVVDGLNNFMKGDNSPSINNENILSWLYPLPPIAEQEKIVKKINDIISILDTISVEL